MAMPVVGDHKCCHFAGMTDKAPPAGWVVQAIVPAPPSVPSATAPRWRGLQGESAPSFKYFNVAIEDAQKAVAAAAAQMSGTEGVKFDAVRALSAAELATAHLKTGQLKPA
jgi:hypothetical protein